MADYSESYELYKTLLDLTPDAVIIAQSNKIVYVNTAGERLYKSPDLIGQNIYTIIHPDYHELLRNRVKHILQNGYTTEPAEYQLRCHDGSVLWGEIKGSLVNYNGERAILSIVRDITSRKKLKQNIENDLSRRKKNYQMLYHLHRSVQSLPLGITIINLDGIIIYTNNAEASMHGYEKDELLGKSARIFAPERLWNKFTTTEVTSWNGYTRQSINTRKDGTEFPVELTSEIIRGKQNEPSSIVTICEDISNKRTLERELVRLQNAIETTQVGITITNDQGHIVYVNTAGVNMHGYENALELIGKQSNILAPVRLRNQDQRSQGSREEYPTWRRESVNITKSGDEFPVEIISNPIYDNYGQFIGRVSTCTNITERKSIEDTLHGNEERLEALLSLSQMDQRTDQDISDYVLEEAVKLTKSEIGYLHFIDRKSQDIQLHSWSRSVIVQCHANVTMHYPLDKAGIWADCVRTGQPVIHNEYIEVDHKTELPEGHIPLHRHMSVPVYDSGEIIAIAGVGNKETPYTQLDVRQLSLFTKEMWNILKKKQADRQSKSHQKLLKTIIDTIPDYIFVKNTRREIVLVNKAFVDFYGSTSEKELLGKKEEDLFPLNSILSDSDDHDILLNQRSIINEEDSVIHPQTGNVIWVLSSKVPLYNSSGQVIGIVNFLKNVSDYKALLHEHEQLKESYKLIAHQTTHFLEKVNESYEYRPDTERFRIEE